MLTQLFIILFAFFVQFTDKAGSEQIALSQAALDKRAERNIAIDSLDYAVSPVYMDSLEALGVHIYHSSRWLNGATIETDQYTAQHIAEWAFVDTIYLTRQLRDDNLHEGEEDPFGIPSVSLRRPQHRAHSVVALDILRSSVHLLACTRTHARTHAHAPLNIRAHIQAQANPHNDLTNSAIMCFCLWTLDR